MSKEVVTALHRNMRRALNEGRLTEAGEILDRLRREDPVSLETRGFELEYQLESGRLPDADRLAKQLCRLYPGSARVHFLQGKTAYRLRQYSEAESSFRESQRLYPHWQSQYWLGRSLTQLGAFEEAEALLSEARVRFPRALLDLSWLHQRRGDFQAALEACDAYLAIHPDDDFARNQRTRIRAGMMDPEALIDEMGMMESLGEEIPASVLPEYVRRLFETGQAPKAREEIERRREKLEPRTSVEMAWICYRARAYDLACVLFLAQLDGNLANSKFLVALETAARHCDRLADLLDEYERRAAHAPNLHGRRRALMRRGGLT